MSVIANIKVQLIYLCITFVLLISSCKSTTPIQKTDEVKISKELILDFPFDALGYWKGEIEIFMDTGRVQKLEMAMLIAESPDPSVYEWKIIYNPDSDKEDRRNYLLLTIDSETGHYQIDEDNGIILDCYLLDNKLISTFEVSGSILTTINTFIGDGMVFEVIMGPSKEINITGDIKVGEHTIPPVKSFKTSTYQRAFLYRKRG